MIRGDRIWLDQISTSYGTQPTVGMKGDFDGDGNIDWDDFVEFCYCYNSCVGDNNYNEVGDFDHSGCIDFDDFVAFADVYGT